MVVRAPKIMIGWEEWCALPDLGLPAVKVKVDTGAKTSALHAYDIELFKKDAENWVRFKVHPLQHNNDLEVVCEAPLLEKRSVTSSNGEREKRFVISTKLQIGGREVSTDVTLTSRHKMAFRMLLGRDSLRRARLTVDPLKSFMLGKKQNTKELYGEKLNENCGSGI